MIEESLPPPDKTSKDQGEEDPRVLLVNLACRQAGRLALLAIVFPVLLWA